MSIREAENTIPGTLVETHKIESVDLYYMNVASSVIEESRRGLIKVDRVGADSKGKMLVDVYNFTPDRFTLEQFDEVVAKAKSFEPGDDVRSDPGMRTMLSNALGVDEGSIAERIIDSVDLSPLIKNDFMVRHFATREHLIAELRASE